MPVGQRVWDKTRQLWVKKDPTADEVVLTVQVKYQIPKDERANYDFPNFQAADCLRQDIARFESGEIPLASLLFNQYVKGRSLHVTR